MRAPVHRQRAPEDPGFGFGGGFGGGGGGGGGGGFRRAIDEDTLKAIAEATGATYYPAESAAELNNVFENLPTNLITKHEVLEVSVLFVALGTVLVALAILLGNAGVRCRSTTCSSFRTPCRFRHSLFVVGVTERIRTGPPDHW